MPRTEDQICRKAPIEITLGENKYSIKPLNILRQQEWRKKLDQELAEIVSTFNKQDDGNQTIQGLTAALIRFPEKIVALVFAYAPDLPQEEVLASEATEEQMAHAFGKIMEVAYPYLPQLATVTKLMRTAILPQ
jgi:hypothetical protein